MMKPLPLPFPLLLGIRITSTPRCFSFLFLYSMSTLLMALVSATTTFSNETDLHALLRFKDQIHDDPHLHALSSWSNTTTLHFCHWEGVTCSHHHHQRVTALNLRGLQLSGNISPFIGNLTFLRRIDLYNNSFSGAIPKEIDRLFRLRFLYLGNNTLSGEFPKNLTYCPDLIGIDLSGNQLAGNIPTELGSLSKLERMALRRNILTGSIPSSLGNLSSLVILSLNENRLQGSIPDDLGRLVRLEYLSLSLNRLSGSVPLKLYNISSIKTFAVHSNNLHGQLPSNLGLNLPNLEGLYVHSNQFTGSIPVSLSNASGLILLALNDNSFSGSVPMIFGSFKGLYRLNLASNRLGNGNAHDLSFINLLTNCSNLRMLIVSKNRFSGALPTSIANLSTQLQHLWLDNNMIFGSIPSGIQNLVGLASLNLEYNRLTGTIPAGIGKLNKVEVLSFGGNKLSGNIPSSFGNITRLNELYLYSNSLQGGIPSGLGNFTYLQFLYLGQNNFSGALPKQLLLSNPSLTVLDVQNNFFTGNLLVEVGYLKNLQTLIASDNQLSGEIPISLGSCVVLEYLLLDGNLFQGPIPSAFSTLRGLQSLHLSRNNLSGEIPIYLETLLSLQHLNLSFNDFEGELPKQGVFQNASAVSVRGNSKLCGGILELQLPACPTHAYRKHGRILASKVKIAIISVALFLVMVLCFFAIVYWVRRSRKKPSSQPALEESSMNVSYTELFKATEGFASANLIGTRSFGSVYKGILDRDGTIIAGKVLNLQQQGALKGFMAECEALRSVRHRNLVKILTCCSSIDFNGNDFKALIFKYMPNGSLDKWLHGDDLVQLSRNLNFTQRVNIAIDVASALDYLHHHCHRSIIHRDLKPSNILLDDDMVAHVGDFGLARFLADAQTSSIGVKGSIGYIAPEYAMGGKASTHGDVYSFGILLLEMMTGKRPTDDMFKDNLSLHHFVNLALPERAMEIADPRLLEQEEVTQSGRNHSSTRNRMHDCLVSMARIGVLCSRESPSDRMDMRDVVVEMQSIKDLYLEVEIHRNRQIRSGMPNEGPSYLSHY